jgi:16S rRNA (guanine527-N7)-methyltransferase
MCDRKQFLTGLDRLDIRLEDDRIDNILLYCRELRKWNKRINLIARHTSAADIMEKHFLDSLTLLPIIEEYGMQEHGGSGFTLLDVGTGAGFPGLVLAAVMPELHVTLAEPRQKRVAFLRHIIRTLQLTNVQVADRRIESGQGREEPKDEFTFITSRAVAAVDSFLPMIECVATHETLVIMMGAGDDRLDDQRKWIDSEQGAGWQFVENKQVSLPFSHHPRVLSMVRKKRIEIRP